MSRERKTGKRAFVYYFDWAETLLDMPADIRLKIDDAIKRYALYGEEPDDPTVKYSPFALIRQQIDRNNGEYAERCERTSRARSEAGRKGNETRWGKVSQKSQKSQTSQTSPDSDSDSDSDNINIPPISYEICPPTGQGGGVPQLERVDNGKNDKKQRPRFVKPTVEEVKAYITEKGYTVNAEHFVSYYEANGWKVGRNAMKDWRAAVRTWESRNINEGKAITKKQNGNTQTDMHRPSEMHRTVDVCGKSVNLGSNEYIDANGRRTYGSGRVAIPMNAPPRPSDKYTWDAATQKWICL